MPTSQIGIPIIVNIVLIFGYIFLGAMVRTDTKITKLWQSLSVSPFSMSRLVDALPQLFKSWEEWSLSDAIYFSFITLSTIGFGDLVPAQSFSDSTMKTVVATIYCSVGRAQFGTGDDLCRGIFIFIFFWNAGLAVLSICLALIQEQISKRAARAMNANQEKVSTD